MTAIAKPLVPNQTWIVRDDGRKIGTLNKEKTGYVFFTHGTKIEFSDLKEAQALMGLDVEQATKPIKAKPESTVYGYACKNKAYNPLYDVKRKLPIYTKSAKSTSKHCAGYYLIKFPKNWVKSFSPKLITLERYPYKGPFRTESEVREELVKVNRERS